MRLLEKFTQSLARALIQMDVRGSAFDLGVEKIQDYIGRALHIRTLTSDSQLGNLNVLLLAGWRIMAHVVRIPDGFAAGVNFFPEMPEDPMLPETDAAAHWYSASRLWAKLKKIAAVAGEKTLLTTLTLFYCLQDKDTPKWAKGVIIGALGYLIMPLDLIPDVIPGAGYGDDWGALVAALGTVAAYIKDEHKEKATAQVARLFRIGNPSPPAEFFE